MLNACRASFVLLVSVLACIAAAQIKAVEPSQVRVVTSPQEMAYTSGQYQQNPVQAWDERQNVQLLSDLRVDIGAPGEYHCWQDLGNFVIPAGSRVSSSFIYFGRRRGYANTLIRFKRRVLGVIVLSERPDGDLLLASDYLALPDVPPELLPSGHFQGRGLEMPARRQRVYYANGDSIWVYPDAVAINLTVGANVDEIRVITAGDNGPIVVGPPSVPTQTVQVIQAGQIQPVMPTSVVEVPPAPSSWNFGLDKRLYADPAYQTGPILIYPQSIIQGISFGANVPVLSSGYRIGYVQADPGFHYGWDGYAYWPYTQVVYSPWYYYPSLPPYINLSVATLQTPPVYVNPVPYTYVVAGSGGSLEPLDQAINYIFDSFQGNGVNAIDQLLPADGNIAIYLGGVYRYSVAESGFSTMLDDLLKGAKTTGYRIVSVDKYDGGSVLVVGAQDTVDPWGNKFTVYQEYRLIEEDGKWAIREFGTSSNPIPTNILVLKHLEPLSPPAVTPPPPVPDSFNFGLNAKVYQNQALQRGSILINPVSIVHGVTFASPVPMLDSGFRIGFVQPDSLFKYSWAGYAYWPYDQVVFSPWYFYPSLPPYLNLSVVYTDAAPAYEDPVAYKWSPRGSGNPYTPLDDAIEGIVSAYHGQSASVLPSLFPPDGYVGIYLDGDYRYSVDSDSFAAMMRDVTTNVRTSTYRILSVDKFKDESVLVVAEHVIIDPWGRKSWVYQSFRLEQENGKWLIREFGTSDKVS